MPCSSSDLAFPGDMEEGGRIRILWEQSTMSDQIFEEDKEQWVEWIKRSTTIAESSLRKAGIEDWIMGQRRRKYRWAGHVARRDDVRWSTAVLDWTPTWGQRGVGHSRKRWSDLLSSFFSSANLGRCAWMYLAQCRESWTECEDSFCQLPGLVAGDHWR